MPPIELSLGDQRLRAKDAGAPPSYDGAAPMVYCEQYGVPYALGIAMAEIETHFDADAVSSTSDYGLMQINKCNHDWLLKEGFDVTTYDGNIGAGIYMIGGYIETYGDIGLALMAYNCGPSGAQKLWSQGVNSTDYTRKVMDAYNRWSEVLEVAP